MLLVFCLKFCQANPTILGFLTSFDIGIHIHPLVTMQTLSFLFLLSTAVATALENYDGMLTQNKVVWKNNIHPPNIGSSHADAMSAVNTILLSLMEKRLATDGNDDHQFEQQAASKTSRNKHQFDNKHDEDICGSNGEAPEWPKERLKLHKASFNSEYKFWTQMGNVLIGTNGIDLTGFDGMIRLRVRDDTLSLIMHNACETETEDSTTCSSNVKPGLSTDCDSINMMTLQLKFNKLGLGLPSVDLDWKMKLLVGDFPNGIHLHNLPLGASTLLPQDHKYDVKIRLALSVQSTFNPSTRLWDLEEKDVHLCSPGLELVGDFESGSFNILKWLVEQKKSIIVDNVVQPVYCALKYTLPYAPWLGQTLTFVAEDELRKKSGTHSVEDNMPSEFQFTFDNKLTVNPTPMPYDMLHLRTGWQLNVPTLRFVSHLLATSKEIAQDNQRQMKDSKIQSNLNKKEKLLLKRLIAMGFDESVFGAIKQIELYIDKLTRDTAELSTTLAGITENVWNVLFSTGNDLQIEMKGGVGIGKDKNGGNGGVSGKLENFHISSLTKHTPLNMDIFFTDPLDLIAGLVPEASTSDFIVHENDDNSVKNFLVETTKRKGNGDAPLSTVVTDIDDQDSLFYMKGKTTLVDIKDAEITGTLNSLVRHKDKVDAFLDHEMAQRIVQNLLHLMLQHKVSFDLTTENDLPGASIDKVSITTKRLQIGGLIGYNGPMSINKLLQTMKRMLNEMSKETMLREQKKRENGELYKCMSDVEKKYFKDQQQLEKIALKKKEACKETEVTEVHVPSR